MEYVKQNNKINPDDKIEICPLCGEKSLHVLGTTDMHTKQCISCGYATTFKFKMTSEKNEHYESLTDELKKWSKEADGYLWIPSFITLPFGMLYPFNNKDNEMKWAVAEMIDIPEDEQKNYPIPDQEGKFYTQKFDTDNAKTFDEFLYAMHDINEKAKKDSELGNNIPNLKLNLDK